MIQSSLTMYFYLEYHYAINDNFLKRNNRQEKGVKTFVHFSKNLPASWAFSKSSPFLDSLIVVSYWEMTMAMSSSASTNKYFDRICLTNSSMFQSCARLAPDCHLKKCEFFLRFQTIFLNGEKRTFFFCKKKKQNPE